MAKNKKKLSSLFSTQDVEPEKPETQDDEEQKSICSLVTSMYLNPDYSDLMIICQNKTLPAHRFIVCPRSDYFRAACEGKFKENEGTIHLNEKAPFLIEKVLEFLYTGNYTIKNQTAPTIGQRANRDEVRRNSSDPPAEVEVNLSSDEHTTDCLDVAGGDAMNEFSVLAPEYSAKGCISLSSMNGCSPEISGHSERGLTQRKHAVNEMSDNLDVYHPCYFHLRMYGEADYFLINELKSKAEARFCAALGDFPDKESFAEVVKELYSSRAKYRELRKLAMNVIVDKLPDLQKGFTPAIDSRLLELVPDFACDLCLRTIDEYVNTPLNMKPYSFATGVHINGVDYMRNGI